MAVLYKFTLQKYQEKHNFERALLLCIYLFYSNNYKCGNYSYTEGEPHDTFNYVHIIFIY